MSRKRIVKDVLSLRYIHKARSRCPMVAVTTSDLQPFLLMFPSGQLDWTTPDRNISFWTPTGGLTITLPKRLPYTITEEELLKYLVLI
jgi:hypothetical protein